MAGISWPLPEWREIHRQLKDRRHHVTVRLLWVEWKADHPDGWNYSQFCYHYRSWLGVQDVVMRLSYGGGERMFVDFSGDKARWVDPETGEVREAEVFVSVLGASGLIYAEATRSQDLDSWLGAHIHAWEAYGGVATVTVPDNLKSGVTKACWYDPEVNVSYLELARHFNTVILPTRTAKPRDKAAVEAGVMSVERWVLAPLRNRTFHSLGEVNEAMAGRVAELNARAFRGEPTSRRELFDELEREHLPALPAGRFELPRWRPATAHIDYPVDAGDGHYDSVPYRYVRHKVDVRVTAATVEVFKGMTRIQPPPGARPAPLRQRPSPHAGLAPSPSGVDPRAPRAVGWQHRRAHSQAGGGHLGVPAPPRARLPGHPGHHRPGSPAPSEACRDLLEVIEDRAERRATAVASQLPVDKWHAAMADPTLAEAVLDRLCAASHRHERPLPTPAPARPARPQEPAGRTGITYIHHPGAQERRPTTPTTTTDRNGATTLLPPVALNRNRRALSSGTSGRFRWNAHKAKEEGKERVILFGYSGHGLLDLQAYDDYLNGRLDAG